MFDKQPWDRFLATTNAKGGYGKIDEERGVPMPDQKALKELEKNG